MTSETKTTIGPEDVLAIELECTRCGTRVSRLLRDYHSDPHGCPNCGDRWHHLTQEFGEMSRLVMALRMFADKCSGNSALPFRMRMEIAQPKALGLPLRP